MNILAELRGRFALALQSFSDDPAPFVAMVKPSQDSNFGDFQANCAMPLAKQRKINPRDLATEIVAALDVADFCHEPEIAGPGFINLRLKDEWLQSTTNGLIADKQFGVEQTETPRNIVVDYSGPNVAKPMHVGHLRSTVIGDALCNVLQFLGHRVVKDNHIGDWGTQFGMIIYGYKNFLDQSAFESNPVEELARLYRLVSQLSDYHNQKLAIPKLKTLLNEKKTALTAANSTTDPNDKKSRKALRKLKADVAELEEQIANGEGKLTDIENDPVLHQLVDAHPNIADDARAETAKLHAGDQENRQLWEQFLPSCLESLSAMYDRMGIEFDTSLGESFYQPMLADVVSDLQSKNIAAESEDAICVFIEGNNAPFIIRKKDNAFTYATTDLATIQYRVDHLKADEILYVVDARQSEHFNLLFATARMWGYDKTEIRHISFGTILGSDKKPFKTRSGDTVGLESLLDEAIARARTIVDENDNAKPAGPELDEQTRTNVAEMVGIGGIKYADLHHNRESDYVFSWEKMLATTGDTATYMQYAHARICGIFRRGNIDRELLRTTGKEIQLAQPEERSLALQLNRFAEAIENVVAEYRPNMLTQYLFETANCFSSFYDKCHVLNETDEVTRTSRLLLCDLTARVLAKGLELLGIQACEQM